MDCFLEMLKKVSSSRHYEAMLHFSAPLKEHFGINHFWYFKINSAGHYSYAGTHAQWNEFCFKESFLHYFPCIKHPSLLNDGISLMKADANPDYLNLLALCWEQFQINFHFNLVSQIQDGIEAFGFASHHNDLHADERLLNQLPALQFFIKRFRQEHTQLFSLLDDHSINLTNHRSNDFYTANKSVPVSFDGEKFLYDFGFKQFLQLTPREQKLLPWIAYGYSAAYIATQFCLSTRTVENYIAAVKCKLACKSKTELMHKAQEMVFFNNMPLKPKKFNE